MKVSLLTPLFLVNISVIFLAFIIAFKEEKLTKNYIYVKNN